MNRLLCTLLVALPMMAQQPKPSLSTEVALSPSAQSEIDDKMHVVIASAGVELAKTRSCESHQMAFVALIAHNEKGEIVLHVDIYCKPSQDDQNTQEEPKVPHS